MKYVYQISLDDLEFIRIEKSKERTKESRGSVEDFVVVHPL
jgi:hypothetical protein